ncbi:uncharacterized protein LOC106160403 [Lingula anatina]|uniref:Uncharacterized protein LOC106160403 n=1 Tax=Lingula anatina TaxID=7574 RepID=A0A1S3I506_LINAN|nr:uncharacterized protein LOC106160403 [Lingula anatina]|eukprot:XP_013392449.1 uncharacterized protein LOC106160403 [Lingula anatina]
MAKYDDDVIGNFHLILRFAKSTRSTHRIAVIEQATGTTCITRLASGRQLLNKGTGTRIIFTHSYDDMPQKVFLVGIELNPRAKHWRAALVDSLKTQSNEEFHFLDETNIPPGAIIIDELIDFIRNCDKTVLVITSDFLSDPSCLYAANLALSLENDTERPRRGSVVVVLLQDTIVPYKYTHKRDVIHHDDPEFLKKLSKQLSKELEWGTKPLVHGIQVHNPHNLLGRTDDVVFIAESFMGQVPEEGSNMFGISGAPGIGKTSLATLICRYIYRRMFLHIYWIHCGKAPDVVKIISSVRRHLQGSESQEDFADRISARSWLIQFTMHEKILFVLDDVWNPDDASVFTAISKDCLLLITTRDRAVINMLNVRIYTLDHLDVENAWQLFLKCANVTEKLLNDHKITKEANAIHSYLGGYPLAIALVASSLRQGATSVSQPFSSQRWRDMAASLKEKDKLWMESRRLPIDSYPETFVGAFEATFACLRDAGDTNKPYSMLQEILLKVSLFKKDALIQSSTLAILCSYMQDKSNAEKQDKVARHVRECLFTLADKSLLRFKLEDEDGDCYFRIHDLVLQYIQNKTETLWGPDGIRRMHTALLAAYVAAAEGTAGLQHIEKLQLEEPAAGCSAEKDRSDSGFQDDLERSAERHSPSKGRPMISGSNTNSSKDQLGCSSCYENDQAIVLSYPWWNLDFSGDKYVYTNFIHHCTAMGKEFKSLYRGLLCSFRWLQAKLNKTSLSEIISDFELFECDCQFSHLHGAINKALLLHAPAIIRDKKQLGPVFLGSLSNLEIVGISDFLKAVRSQLFEDADSCFLPDRACISPPNGHVVKTYSAHNGTAVLGLGVLKDSTIVTTSGDGFVRLIDPITGGETCLGSDLTKHNDLVTCFGVNSSETLVVTAACDSVVKLWDLKGKCLRETFSNIHNRQIFSLVLSADGESGLTVSGDKTIKLWYLNDGSVQFTYAALTDVVACACFTNLSEKEIFFASCSYDESVCLWRKNSPECPVTSCNPKLGVLYTLFFSRYQRQLYVGGKTGIGVLNFPSLEVRRILKGHEGGTFALCLARYESHSLLLSGGADGRVKFWDLNDDHSLVFQVQIHSAAVRGIQCAFQEKKDDYLHGIGRPISKTVVLFSFQFR